jgi:hypothetical protein
MKISAERRIWVFAAVGALVAGALVLALFRSPKPAKPASLGAPSGRIPNVGLAKLGGGSADALLREEATMRDPTPLFLPTAWNAGGNAIPAEAQREPGGTFSGYAPKLTYAETELQLALPAVVAMPKTSAEACEIGQPAQSFWGFGQADWVAQPLAARGAYVEVLAAGDGQRKLAFPLAEARPPGEAPWQPLQFLVAVDAAGVVGSPVLTESSRVAAVDGYFQNFITATLHVGERLGPGFYRVCIGP